MMTSNNPTLIHYGLLALKARGLKEQEAVDPEMAPLVDKINDKSSMTVTAIESGDSITLAVSGTDEVFQVVKKAVESTNTQLADQGLAPVDLVWTKGLLHEGGETVVPYATIRWDNADEDAAVAALTQAFN